jgi:uncharacterized membrane protein YozB (DUF420 family)
MKTDDDALKALFDGLPARGLSPRARADIMEGVRRDEMRRKQARDGRLEWILAVAGLASVAGVAVAAFAFLPDVSAVGDIFSDLRMPRIPPIYVLVAVCSLVLLVGDMLVRKLHRRRSRAR